MGEQTEVLEHHRDVMTAQFTKVGLRHLDDVFTIDENFAGRGLDQSGEASHQGRLARTGQTHDDEDLARTYLEADVAHCRGAARLGEEFRAGEVSVG